MSRFWCTWLLLTLFSCHAMASNETVNINHWADFLAKDTRSSFIRNTGITVTYSESASMEQLAHQMDQGSSGFDSITPSHVLAAEMMRKGQLQKLDKSLLPNLKNLDPAILQRLQSIDPDNQYLVPFSFTGIILGYNETAISARLGEELPENKLELLFNPHYSDRLKECGINLIDYPADAYSMALAYIGKNPLSTRQTDLLKAQKALTVIRPNISQFRSDTYLEDLAKGRLCLTTGFSSDIMLAKTMATNAKRPYAIKSAIVPDQSPGYFTVLAIPQDAKNPKAAMHWINHLLDAKVSAAQTKEVGIATGNLAANRLLPDEMLKNPLLVLGTETYRKFYLPVEIPSETRQLQEKLWRDLKGKAL